jgi:hypothetical protein
MLAIRPDQRGISLLVALIALLITSACGLGLVMATKGDATIAANFAAASQAQYAAEAAVERSLEDLVMLEWRPVLAGELRSRFVDGVVGRRTLRDGTVVDVGTIANLANCGHVAGCSEEHITAATADRPRGSNNPHWQLFAYGTLESIIGTGTVESPFFVAVLVADDSAENDGNPLEDGAEPADGAERNPGAGILALRGVAFGPRGSYAAIEVTVSRSEEGLQTRSWRALR